MTRWITRLGATLAVAVSLLGTACHRQSAPRVSDENMSAESSPTADTELDAYFADPSPSPGKAIATREVNAAWYEVPPDSLARRRAGVEELTAAHNRLPLGTRVRVTHLANGKSVIVRITDRGIHDGKTKLDLCKEAATELGMVSKGITRVRMEVLLDGPGASPARGTTAAAR